MNDPKCSFCGHLNLTGAEVCARCDFPLDDADEAGAGGNFGRAGATFRDYAGGPRAGAAPGADPPQFQTAGDVISPTLAVYRTNFVAVGILVLVTTLPVALLQYAFMRAASEQTTFEIADGSLLTSGLATQLLAGLLSFVGTALVSGALVYVVVEIQRTGAASAGESLRRGLRVLPKVFLMLLLVRVVTLIGYLLLIVPGVIFSLMYSVAVPVAVAEGRGPVEALRRSARLTDGYKGLIFLTQFLWGVIVVAATMIVTWSFLQSEELTTLPVLVVTSVVSEMLNSSSSVLSVYIFLGLLNERGDDLGSGPDARQGVSAPAAGL